MRNKSKKIGSVVDASPSILKPEDQLCVRLMNEFLTVYVCQRRELVRVASYLCLKEEKSIEGRFDAALVTEALCNRRVARKETVYLRDSVP